MKLWTRVQSARGEQVEQLVALTTKLHCDALNGGGNWPRVVNNSPQQRVWELAHSK